MVTFTEDIVNGKLQFLVQCVLPQTFAVFIGA